MPAKRTFVRIGLISLIIFFLFGVAHLFQLRFKAGDIYPPYSSLRSDPLGTLAFYESLTRMDSVEATRIYKPFAPQDLKRTSTTLFYLGLSPSAHGVAAESFARPLMQLASRGGRVVVTFLPITQTADEPEASETDDTGSGGQSNEPGPDDQTADSSGKLLPEDAEPSETDEVVKEDETMPAPLDDSTPVSFESKWSVGFRYLETKPEERRAVAVPAVDSSESLPAVSWHSLLYFETESPVWHTIYTFAGRPVIVERDLGRGTLVLCADSYFLSNEALRDEPHAKLLARLLGDSRRIIFDEFHHGVAKRPGVASLIRKYDLQWALLGIAVLAVLFVWQRATPFMAPLMQAGIDGDDDIHRAKDYTQGLISLLRRNVVTKDLIPICIKEWQSALPILNRSNPNQREDVMRSVEALRNEDADRTDPVTSYNHIRRITVEKLRR